jgi:hypothetical protein
MILCFQNSARLTSISPRLPRLFRHGKRHRLLQNFVPPTTAIASGGSFKVQLRRMLALGYTSEFVNRPEEPLGSGEKA